MFRGPALAAALSVTLGAAAFAHAGLKSSSIEDGAVFVAAPQTVTLEFTGEVGLAALELRGADGGMISTGFEPDRRMRRIFTAAMPDIADGAYFLEWRAMARDGHIMNGQISFTVETDAG